jgi:hypothetical protein
MSNGERNSKTVDSKPQLMKFMTPKAECKHPMKNYELDLKKESDSEDDYIPIEMINKSYVDSGRKM